MKDQMPAITSPETIRQLEAGEENPFIRCQEMADEVADLMERDDARARPCLRVIEQTYDSTACRALRLAIENSFLYHLGTRIFTSAAHSLMLGLLPRHFQLILLRQMSASGI